MKCIYCEHKETDVVNSRKSKASEEVWRRRYCNKCKETFTTAETFSCDSLFVIKRNLARKRFVYEKLLISIFNAVAGGKGSDAGDSAMIARDVAQNVIKNLLLFKSKYVSTRDIIERVYHELSLVSSFHAQKYAMYSRYRMHIIQGKQ